MAHNDIMLDDGFILVTFDDDTRWKTFPEQKTEIGTSLFLAAKVSSMMVLYTGNVPPTLEQKNIGSINYWWDTNTHALYDYWWDTDQLKWTTVSNKVVVQGSYMYIRHDNICDTAYVIRRTLTDYNFANYTTSLLQDGVDVTRLNSEVIRVPTSKANDILLIFTINADIDALSPTKIVDSTTDTVLQDAQLWHPARGYHSYHAAGAVDTMSDVDPAQYLFTLSPTNTPEKAWNSLDAGTVWVDTSHMGYLPYYDDKIYPSVNDRLYNWGKLAPWASINVYQWVNTTVPPYEWDKKVLLDAGNKTLSQQHKATGSPRNTVFKRSRDSFVVVNDKPNTMTVNAPFPVQEGDLVAFTTTDTLPVGVEIGQWYTAINVEKDISLQIAEEGSTTPIVFNTSHGIATLETAVVGTMYKDGNYTGVSLTGGSGTGATADIAIQNGMVRTVLLVNEGSGYKVGDTLSANDSDLGGAGGSGFTTNVLTVTTSILTLSLTSGGSALYNDGEYSSVPLHSVTGTGSGATANIVVSGGVVTTVTIVNPGKNYQSGDQLTASANNIGGTGAGFTINVATATSGIITSGSYIAGTGYNDGTFYNVPLTGGSGSGAAATITITNGSVSAGNVTNPGTGYKAGDILSFDPPAALSITTLGAHIGGLFYTDGIYNNVSLIDGTGSGAKASLTVTFGTVSLVTLTNGGSGYTVGDVLTVSPLALGNNPLAGGFTVVVDTVLPVGGSGFTMTVFTVEGKLLTVSGPMNSSLYNDGTYTDVPLTGGSGTGARASSIIISGGVVTNVVLDPLHRGVGYKVGNGLSAATADLGGTGSGFIVNVSAIDTAIDTLGKTIGGLLYTNGRYTSVPLINVSPTGTGRDARATVIVRGNVISSVEITQPGENYLVGDVLTVLSVDVGGTGSGFQTTVTSLNDGTGVITCVTAFEPNGWVEQKLIRETQYVPFVYSAPFPKESPTITLTDISWESGDVAQVYVNGKLSIGYVIVNDDLQIEISPEMNVRFYVNDIIDIIRPIHYVTQEELDFTPDVYDDLSTNTQWINEYQYSTTTITTGGLVTGATNITYYNYWIEGNLNRVNKSNIPLSPYEIALQLKTIPTPYVVLQRPQNNLSASTVHTTQLNTPVITDPFASLYGQQFNTEAQYLMPTTYRQAIIRNAASYITGDGRYTIRFMCDPTLRDYISSKDHNLNSKSVHEEWMLIRRNQNGAIPRELWDKLIESIVGYKLSDLTTVVPALERTLYDAANGTDTRYGLGEDQAFVDGVLAKATVIDYLQNPAHDFYPLHINDFFTRHNFDTPEATVTAMNEIYTTFSSEHVNAIWFDTLLDALSTRAKYKEIMKTSWIALHGIQVLNSKGVLDD